MLGAHQLIETVYQLVSRNDAETMRFLNDLVILAVHANPDGMQLVSSWYMREKDPQRRSTNGLPRLYEKYAGHDNNRDFYMSNLPESINMNKVLYTEWFPQIMYNHHQTGPAGAVMFAPRSAIRSTSISIRSCQSASTSSALRWRTAWRRKGSPG